MVKGLISNYNESCCKELLALCTQSWALNWFCESYFKESTPTIKKVKNKGSGKSGLPSTLTQEAYVYRSSYYRTGWSLRTLSKFFFNFVFWKHFVGPSLWLQRKMILGVQCQNKLLLTISNFKFFAWKYPSILIRSIWKPYFPAVDYCEFAASTAVLWRRKLCELLKPHLQKASRENSSNLYQELKMLCVYPVGQ